MTIQRICRFSAAAGALLLLNDAAWAQVSAEKPSAPSEPATDAPTPPEGQPPQAPLGPKSPAETTEPDAPNPPTDTTSPNAPSDRPAPSTQPSPPPQEDEATIQARDAFRLGSTLARQGQWNEALASFERSARLKPHPVTTYNIGYVERALGNYTRARAAFARALDSTAWPAAATLPPNLANEARSYLAEIDRKLARVVVSVDPADTAITIDGRPLERIERDPGRPLLIAGTARSEEPEAPPAPVFDLLIDPGSHVIVLSRPGQADRVMNRAFASGSSTSLELSMQDEGSDTATATPARMAVTPVQDQGVEEGPSRTWAWVAYGVGGAALAVGTGFGISALRKDSFLQDNCQDGECPPSDDDPTEHIYQDRQDDLRIHANLATAGFVIGGTGVAAGTLLLLLTGDGEDEAPRSTERGIDPWIGLGSAGVRGTF